MNDHDLIAGTGAFTSHGDPAKRSDGATTGRALGGPKTGPRRRLSTRVLVVDEDEAGVYSYALRHTSGRSELLLKFDKNGDHEGDVSEKDLLMILRDRLSKGAPSREASLATTKVDEALHWLAALQARKQDESEER